MGGKRGRKCGDSDCVEGNAFAVRTGIEIPVSRGASLRDADSPPSALTPLPRGEGEERRGAADIVHDGTVSSIWTVNRTGLVSVELESAIHPFCFT
jgi:hypothetical protein